MIESGLVFFAGLGISFLGLTFLEKLGVRINDKLLRIVVVSGLLAAAAYAFLNNPLKYWLQ